MQEADNMQEAGNLQVKGWGQILRGRWRLTLVMVVLALAATAAMAARPGPYQAQSQVVFLPSKDVSATAGGNPYLSFTDTDAWTADLVRRELTAQPTVARLAAEGFSSSYQVVDDPLTTGPVLDVTVTGNNQAKVEQTLQGVAAAVGTTLAGMQANLKPSKRMTSLTVSNDPNAILSISMKAHILVIVLGIGIVLAIAVPQVVDAIACGRRSRRMGTAPSSPHQPEREIITTASAPPGSYRPSHRGEMGGDEADRDIIPGLAERDFEGSSRV
jgi:hypothetical protein